MLDGKYVIYGRRDVIMMTIYNAVLRDCIKDERKGKLGYGFSDKKILNEMTEEINKRLGTNIHYLTEIDSYNIHGAGAIMLNYIERYKSETIKAYMIHQFVDDRIPNCAQMVVDLYREFRSTEEYIPGPGESSPAHIYVRYDNAFKRLKPRYLKEEFIDLISNPRDAFYLPLTVRMVASWKDSRVKEKLLYYYSSEDILSSDVGLKDGVEGYFPPLNSIRRELKFRAIYGLRYYPCDDVIQKLHTMSECDDKDYQEAAKKSLKYINNHSRTK
jgi:hypothetical protein